MQGNINIPDSTITTNLSFRQLVLMNMQQLTNFPYIEKDFDALTDYELLCLVVKFLNDVIANQNEQNASITRMYESFLALQTYVNNTKDTLEDAFNNLDDYVRNYFDNLDVQEEINNKLDQMLEDGILEQIIEQFLQLTSLLCFDNVSDMQDSPNLANGSYARTLGYYNIKDDGGSIYKIRNINNDDIIDNGHIIPLNKSDVLIAENVSTIITPEMFGAYGDGTHNDTTAFNNAILQTKKLILSNKTYKLTQLLINKELTIEGNESTLIDDTSVNEFIKITKPDTIFNVYLNNIKLNCSHSDIGIYNNGCHLNGENITISNSITKNIQIVKTGVYGDCKLNNIFSKSSPIGIQLDATDCFISNYFGYNCLTHIKNNNGVNHFNTVHGWNYNNETDQVTGSTLIDTKADLIGCDIYADTLESVITVPNGYQYMSILLQNVNYFLNTSSYPNTQALPEVVKNYSNYTGYCRIDGLILNANGWVNSSGIYPRLNNYPSRITITNATLTGWYTLAYNPSGVNDEFNANQFSATTSYLNPNTRKYSKKGYKTHIYMAWNLTKSIPNNAEILTLDFTNGTTLYPMFNNISKSNSTMKAIFRSTSTTGLCYNLGISMTGNVIYICNNTGITLGNEGNYGDIEIYIDYDVN